MSALYAARRIVGTSLLRRRMCQTVAVVHSEYPKKITPCGSSASLTTSSWQPFHTMRWYSNQNSSATTNTVTRLDFSILDMDAARIDAFAQTADDMEVLVDQLEEVDSLAYDDIRLLIRPLIYACGRLQEKEKAADLAERILLNCLARIPSDIAKRFPEDATDSDFSAKWPYPDQALYTKVMSIIGGLRSEDAANRANRLFRLMTAEHRAELLYIQQAGKALDACAIKVAVPSMSTFKTLLRAWSVSRTAMGAKEAEQLLVEMEELSGIRGLSGAVPDNIDDRQFLIAPPDVECYNMVLMAYSRVSIKEHPLVADRARALFRRMQQLEHAGNLRLEWFSYHAYLKCIQAIIQESEEELDDTVIDEVEGIAPQLATVSIPKSFLRIYQDAGVHPRAWAFGILIVGLVHRTRDEARIQKADTLVRRLVGEIPFDDVTSEEVSLSQLWPSQETLLALATAWRESQLLESNDALQRIRSWATQSSYLTLHHLHIAMLVWEDSQSPEAPAIVQAMIDGVMDPASSHEPTGQTFAIAMRTWMRSVEENRASKVEDLIFTMNDKYRETRAARYAANETHLDLVLKAWQRMSSNGKRHSGRFGFLYPAEHARSHLDQIQGSKVWDPRNYKHYSTCLKAWAQQGVERDDHETFPAREAASLLADMESRSGESPPAPHCNMVLQACVRTDVPASRRVEAYEIAVNTFNKSNRDPFSYFLAVEIIKRTAEELNEGHLDFIASIVETCQDSGQLTQALIYEATEVLSKTELQRLFHFSESYADMIVKNRSSRLVRKEGRKLRWTGQHPHGLNIANLPKAWSRNTELRRTNS